MSIKKTLISPHGVTLLEIIFVTAILGILAELVAHNFIANTLKYRLNGAARRVAMSLMESRNRSLQQSVNTEVEFLDQGKSYSVWHDFNFNSLVDPGERTTVELEKNYPGVYVDHDDIISFDARGFLNSMVLIDIKSIGSGGPKKRVIEVSLAGSVKVQ